MSKHAETDAFYLDVQMPERPETLAHNGLPTGVIAAATLAVPVLLAGCGSGGGGSSDSSNNTYVAPNSALTITAIDVRVTTDTPAAAITVNGTTQGAAAINFPLNGSPLAADPGKKAATNNYVFLAHVAGGTTDKKYTVIINPGVSSVITALGTRFTEAKHLAARTGFGASLDDILLLAGMTQDQSVNYIVDNIRTDATQAPLPWVNDPLYPNNTMDYKYELVKEWWLREIITTSSPLTERLIAFWGNHFVASINDVNEPQIAWAWQAFLRKNVGGNLRTFVHDMCLEPGMLRYLDNYSNYKTRAPGAPITAPENLPSNENFGRELLELFLLGEGAFLETETTQIYSENDVINVARAFTGHSDDDQKKYLFKPTKHDTSTDMTILGIGPKQFGGTSGNVYDIIDAIMEARYAPGDAVPRTAKLIVFKLWKEFIGTTPTLAQVNALAAVLYPATGTKWELKPLYKALFKHAEFTNYAIDRKIFKIPLELICGFYRSLGLRPPSENWSVAVDDHINDDQDPLAPPNVKGWIGGITWINSKTLLERFYHLLTYGGQLTDANLPLSLMNGYEQMLLNIPRVFPEPGLPPGAMNVFSYLLSALIKDPAYQMK